MPTETITAEFIADAIGGTIDSVRVFVNACKPSLGYVQMLEVDGKPAGFELCNMDTDTHKRVQNAIWNAAAYSIAHDEDRCADCAASSVDARSNLHLCTPCFLREEDS